MTKRPAIVMISSMIQHTCNEVKELCGGFRSGMGEPGDLAAFRLNFGP